MEWGWCSRNTYTRRARMRTRTVVMVTRWLPFRGAAAAEFSDVKTRGAASGLVAAVAAGALGRGTNVRNVAVVEGDLRHERLAGAGLDEPHLPHAE